MTTLRVSLINSTKSFLTVGSILARSYSSSSRYTVIRKTPPVIYDSISSNFYLTPRSGPKYLASAFNPSKFVAIGSSTTPLSSFQPTESKSNEEDYERKADSSIHYSIPAPVTFSDNKEFIKSILEPTLMNYVHMCPLYNQLAEGELFYGGTTLHIYDLRGPPMYGRIPDVQDIIGTVRIQQPVHKDLKSLPGKQETVNEDGSSNIYETPAIIPGSFEYNSMYRLLTTNGFIYLSDYLHKKVADACSR